MRSSPTLCRGCQFLSLGHADVPTRAGWALALTAGLLAVVGQSLAVVEFSVLAITGLVATAASVIARVVAPVRFEIERRDASALVEAGSSTDVVLDVTNQRRWPSPPVTVSDKLPNEEHIAVKLAAVAGRNHPMASMALAYRLATPHRRVLQLGPVTVEHSGSLGLARRRSRYQAAGEVVVHPPLELLRGMVQVSGPVPDQPFDLHWLAGPRSDEFDGLRAYAPGDDLRSVHWPSAARHDELQVRQYRPRQRSHLRVVLDTRPPSHDMTALDITTSIAASVAQSALAAGVMSELATTSGDSTGPLQRRHQRDTILAFAARVLPSDEDVHLRPDPETATVLVTADPQVTHDDAHRHCLMTEFQTSLLISVDASRWGTVDQARAEDRWLHLTGPGQLDAHIPRQPRTRVGRP